MYENPMYNKQDYAAKCIGAGISPIDHNPTVGENIDSRIAQMKAEIARLEESKKSLAPLLLMKISDIRSAMNY